MAMAVSAFVLISLLVFPLISWGQDEEQTRATLKGLQGVHVYVEELNPEVEAEGLTRAQIQSDAEVELREAHIPVLEETQWAKGAPYLYVYLHVFRLPTQTRRYLFYIRVELNQQVMLERDPRIKSPAITWSHGGVGIDYSLDQIRLLVRQQVRKFVTAFRLANPRSQD
jgi:hypothetical protein